MISIKLIIYSNPAYQFTNDEFYCIVGGRCYSNMGNMISLDQFSHESLLIKSKDFEGHVEFQSGIDSYTCILHPVTRKREDEEDWVRTNKSVSLWRRTTSNIGYWIYGLQRLPPQKRGVVVGGVIVVVLLFVVCINTIFFSGREINFSYLPEEDWDGCIMSISESLIFLTDDDDKGAIEGDLFSGNSVRFALTSKQIMFSLDTIWIVSKLEFKGNNGKSDTTYYQSNYMLKSELENSDFKSDWTVKIKRELTLTELIEKYTLLWRKLNTMEVSAGDVKKAGILLDLEKEGVSKEMVDKVLLKIVARDGLDVQVLDPIVKIRKKIKLLDRFFREVKQGSLQMDQVKTMTYNGEYKDYFTTEQCNLFWSMCKDRDTFLRYKDIDEQQRSGEMTLEMLCREFN